MDRSDDPFQIKALAVVVKDFASFPRCDPGDGLFVNGALTRKSFVSPLRAKGAQPARSLGALRPPNPPRIFVAR